MDDGNGHRILARNWTTGILRHHDGEEPEWETLPKKIIWNKKRSTRARSSFFDEKMKKKKKRTKIGEAEELKTSRGGGNARNKFVRRHTGRKRRVVTNKLGCWTHSER